MSTRPAFVQLLFAAAMLLGCAKPPTPISQNLRDPDDDTQTALPRPTEGGPLVRIGRVEIEPPGKVIYIAAGVRHGYEHGTQPMRAWQIYAPPGPEQRFRGPVVDGPPSR